MDVARRGEEVPVNAIGTERGDRPREGQNRSVVASIQDHGDPGAPDRVNCDPPGLDTTFRQGVDHEPAEQILAHHADQSRAQSESRGAAGDDAPRAADGEFCPLEQPLGLPEPRLDVLAGEDQIGVAVTEDDQVEGGQP